jgi:diguanylate cyclase (GGDEF)-like protein
MRDKIAPDTAARRGGGDMPPGVALQPVMDIIDRVTIGYEALPRPTRTADPLRSIEAAMAASHVAAPAVVFIHLPRGVLASGVDLAARAKKLGIPPVQIVWVIRDRTRGGLGEAERLQLRRLRDAGCRLAVDAQAAPSLHHSLVAALRPDFVFLDLGSSGWFADDDLAKAQLAATIAFVARLHGLLIARGLHDRAAALAVGDAGVQYGIGRHLASPVVLHADVARPGDKIVSSSWFQGREVRVMSERGQALETPFLLALAKVVPGSHAGEASFSRLLSEAARALQTEHDTERVLRVAAGFLLQAIPADRLAIFEADHASHRMKPRILAGAGTEGLADMDISMSAGITGWVFSRGLPYRCGDTESHPAAAAIPRTERIRESLLAIPLIAGDLRLGIIDLWRQGLDSFTEEELERGALVSFVVGAAWRSAQMFTDIEERALTDALTGLYNRRWWRDMAPRLMAQSRRTGDDVAVLLMDLDHFKQINDSAGHAAGDAVLRAVSGALQRVIREGDYAVRFGGEEFLIILPGSGCQDALRAAKAVHTAVTELAAPPPEYLRVTTSIGVAAFPEHGQDLDEVVRAADQAMYRAKREGGDRVALAPPGADLTRGGLAQSSAPLAPADAEAMPATLLGGPRRGRRAKRSSA